MSTERRRREERNRLGRCVAAVLYCAVLVDERARVGRRCCAGTIRASAASEDIPRSTAERAEGVQFTGSIVATMGEHVCPFVPHRTTGVSTCARRPSLPRRRT